MDVQIDDLRRMLNDEIKRFHLLEAAKKRADNKYYASRRSVEVLGALIKREKGNEA